ncbi:hypothetical protein Mgra_00009647, partial [Meloidogyne graminicola]
SNQITEEEYNNLLPYQIQGQVFFDLYRLYFSEYLSININLRNKIENDYINPQLIINSLNSFYNQNEIAAYKDGEIKIPKKIRPIYIPNPTFGEGTSGGNRNNKRINQQQHEGSSRKH